MYTKSACTHRETVGMCVCVWVWCGCVCGCECVWVCVGGCVGETVPLTGTDLGLGGGAEGAEREDVSCCGSLSWLL